MTMKQKRYCLMPPAVCVLPMTVIALLAFFSLDTHCSHAELPLPSWRAQWIWTPDGEDADMLLARKDFTLSEIPQQASLSITADSRYQLFLNGDYVCSGPARCAPHHQSFDVLDVTGRLRRGKNVLAIRAHHQRDHVSYYDSSRAGLLAQLDLVSAGQATTVQTDNSWRVSVDESWLRASPTMARFHLEVCDRIDLRRRIDGWKELNFDDRQWSKARVLKRETGWPLPQPNERPTHQIPPWTSLVARDIPFLRERISKAKRLVSVGSIPGEVDLHATRGEGWVDAPVVQNLLVPRPYGGAPAKTLVSAGEPIVIPANAPGEFRTLIYDFGEVQNGRPFLDIKGPTGTVVDIIVAPYLLNGQLPSPIVASTYVDRIVLSGERERWEAFYMKPMRWMAVVFRHLPSEAQLFSAGAMQSEYPFEQKGFLQTPDAPELEALWNAAAKTIRVCTTDAYTDNYRERRQYAQTSYYASFGNDAVFGDTALQRRYLTQIADEQLADGIMPAYAPRHGDDFMVILDSNCFWIRGLYRYLLCSGDDATIRHLLPAARNLLDRLHRYTNADGLIDRAPYPYWLDHALIDRRGANFCLNGHYLGAIEDFSQVLQWLQESDVDVYRQRAERIRVALREKLWDPKKQLFADALIDGELSKQFSEHANAMALALSIATPGQMKTVAAQLSQQENHDFIHRESGVVMVTPAMSHFFHAGLCEAGYLDPSLELLWTRFAHMLEPLKDGTPTNGTLWEEWWLDGTGRNGNFRPIVDGRSDAQTESAFFPGLFARYILGIEPTQPGFREVVLHYHPSSRLHRRHGAIPTPSGLLEVAWEIRPVEYQITVQVPPATHLRVDLSSLGLPARDRITINNLPATLDQIEDGFLNVSPGDHTVRIDRR
ncbi:alpha-L-rhamnosidase-related protein [Novipirellula artificiosorum]|uniref:Bacterial alpha-L-rhamnosidase n=1 Tax=Novipirellula artificiosorum TaxID=2528016 RepID=A0A5C6D598_9BACT|nr:alpha-L-rhamnosidase N-terminal domain-containing protein [Novipirellula artificiosorum]TWU30857.1 Bacterial alpha-L-rhamnosidase [Novipirellula artificiosorum]